MERINLEQGSLAWKLYRMEHNNASEAGALMGVAPSWMQMDTPYKLWQFKQGDFEVEENDFMRHGTRNEPIAREKLGRVMGLSFVGAIFEDGTYSASLDGYSKAADDVTVKAEIKCPAVGKKSESWKAALEGEIPAHYYWQIVHQEMVCPTDQTFFAVYDVTDDELIILDLDECMPGWKEDVVKLRAAWEDFHTNPPEPDWPDLGDSAWKAMEDEFFDAKEALDAAEERVKSAKEALIARVEEIGLKRGRGEVVQVERRYRKGNVQYQNVPELKGVVLEQYRGKTSSYWDVRARK